MPHFHWPKPLREHHRLLLLVLFGLFLSVLFLGRMETDLWETVREWGENALEQTRGLTEIATSKMVWGRLILPAVWIVCSFTAVGTAVLYGSWIYFGFSAGVLLWTVLAVAGWQGPFTVWALVFPQYLCYLPGLFLLYIACLRWYSYLRRKNAHIQTSVRGPEIRMFLLRVFLGLLFYSVGIWAEIRLNPYLLQKS